MAKFPIKITRYEWTYVHDGQSVESLAIKEYNNI